MNAKKVLALSLASAMSVTAFGCTKSESNTKPEASSNATETKGDDESQGSAATGDKRSITLGTWYDMYYTSDHHDIDDQPGVTKRETAQMQLDNIREIEKKYNIDFHVENMTWEGVIASINSSIMAGKPDVDIYMTDLQFGVPAVLKGYALPASQYGAEDRLKEANVIKGLKVGQDEDTYLFTGAEKSSNAVYILGFNMDMIKENNLENPQDIYDRGEWTWDKFMEYLKVLTKDKDSDGAIDVYGYGGWWTTFLQYMLLSNDADIAGTDKEHLSDPKTVEVLDFIYKMYQVEKVARPWDPEVWDENNYCYTKQETAFWISANWIADGQGDAKEDVIPFEVGYVPFPKGPSASDNYATKATAGNWYIIPKGVDDPAKVFDVMYDWTNWYKNDEELRDDNEWASGATYSPRAEDPERNFRYLLACADREAYDPWQSLQVDGNGIINTWNIMEGVETAAQYVEANKQIVQDAIDSLFKK